MWCEIQLASAIITTPHPYRWWLAESSLMRTVPGERQRLHKRPRFPLERRLSTLEFPCSDLPLSSWFSPARSWPPTSYPSRLAIAGSTSMRSSTDSTSVRTASDLVLNYFPFRASYEGANIIPRDFERPIPPPFVPGAERAAIFSDSNIIAMSPTARRCSRMASA